MDQIAVLERARRRGVGHALLDAVRAFARKTGCSMMRLDVLDFNEDAKAFYLAVGFRPYRHRLVMSVDG